MAFYSKDEIARAKQIRLFFLYYFSITDSFNSITGRRPNKIPLKYESLLNSPLNMYQGKLESPAEPVQYDV